MEEIKIIKQQLKKLSKKGIHIDIIGVSVCLVDSKKQKKAIEEYNDSESKWDGLNKNFEKYDHLSSEKYIVDYLN